MGLHLRNAARWVRARPRVRYPLFVAALLVYVLVGPLIEDGSIWDLCFVALMLSIMVVTFPAHLLPSRSTRESPIFLAFGLVCILTGAFLITFVIEGPLSELVGLIVLLLAVVLVAQGQGSDGAGGG